ncbi:bifunctional homocysteine S-methyltransferase/methylenetetrahydrofolate reductase [Ktedonosporobacter rubrisoli]|uniref:Bifunctional homocysteine S-methyltransferase/methylenetetrahydrofolate reductase n=1 Tax=Ktedonosporobacter rubrisoli TaxID=2509675 RepID=A0A4P6JHW7_KTERU|nr:bifunctional homocysteine S-methyltransferase/methylenetetrahydrofolate reductase [Ktedonosporobacter rubrisoli]QBD74533.1 bifunctional homocysteine S-methyltransferase/methylenetetrahydrofolate reductase [Ktedonosporobacter rubrisoli]
MNTTSPFLTHLRHGPLLCDGGMGTELHARGVPYEHCFEQLNLSSPELIKGIHLDYIAAGAQIIETNTFGANRYRLAEHGLAHAVREINRAGAKIAREARELSDLPIFLAGNIGPLGSPLAPLGSIKETEAYAAFLEQAEALLQAGVDLFLLETFSDITEMRAALSAVRNITDLPIVALMTFTDDGRVASGEDPQVVARTLQEQGADIVGVNCALGPSSMFDVVAAMCHTTSEQLFIAAQPNAGLPKRVGNRFMYIATPDYFATYARRFLDLGVRLIGGCCGTTPQHIAAMRKVLDESVPQEGRAQNVKIEPVPEALQEHKVHPPENDPGIVQTTHLADLLLKENFVVSVEMRPPRSVKYTRFLQNAALLRDGGADIINIPDNAMARVRMNNIAAARLIQQYVGLETIVHFTPRDRNLMAVQSDVIGAHATGIRNILAITGDPPGHGDFPHATGIWDVDSIGLIAMMHNLNQGLDAKGRRLAAQSSFYIGCAANPTATDVALDLERLQQKIESGAMYVMTQPIFDANALLDYLEQYTQRYGALRMPLIVGLQPLHSYQQAEKFHNEVPGIVIPDHIRARLYQAGEAASRVGIEQTMEVFDALAPIVQGVYIMPLDRFELIHELLPYIRSRKAACAKSTV